MGTVSTRHLITFTVPVTGWGAEPCPAELSEATGALKSAQAASKNGGQTGQGQDIQAPRSQAGDRSQDVQDPKACKRGDMAEAAQKAKDALTLLK
jgi:hypothetical protein